MDEVFGEMTHVLTYCQNCSVDVIGLRDELEEFDV